VLIGQFNRSADFHGLLTYAFFACWILGVIAYIGGRIVANRFLIRPRMELPNEPTGPQWVAFVRARAEKLEGLSAALPLAALSLLMPLTLWYFLVRFLAAVASDDGLTATSSDQMISISVFLTGIAHLALAVFSVRFGLKLATRETEDLRESGPSTWMGGWVVATLAGTIPGVLFFLLPTMLIAITGMYFIPIMLIGMAKRIALERGDLGLSAPPA
jgi:hypothetical protein